MHENMPDFVIVGAPRSGTTSLARYLGAHPAIFMAAAKELRFFNKNFSKGIEWYASHFSAAEDGQMCAEATPTYMSDKLALERMATMIPEARVILILREPAMRAWSDYWMQRERRSEKRPFDEVFQTELRLLTEQGADVEGAKYLGRSLYAHHVGQILCWYPREQLHVMVMERMTREPEREYRSVCRFLGIDDSFQPSILGMTINPYVQFLSLTVRRWSKQVPNQTIRRVVARMNTRRDVDYPDMDDSLKATLSDFFIPHNRALEKLLGSPIPEWSTKEGQFSGP